MCGLVLAMGKSTLTASEIGIFKNMLAFDQLRGDHSTGLFGLFRPYNKAPFFKVNKECLEGVDFVRSPLFVNTIGHVTQLAGGAKSTEWAKAMFGHNRYATMGAVNAKNAHPFTHGHITLAHNGTLRNQSLLPDSEKFVVDSENICYSIATIGVEETVKRLNGAFALIWFDAKEMTINLLRNDEREFHLFETSAGDWYGCSEEKMGDWLLTRGKTGKTIKRHFELTPGVQYIFDVSKGCELKEERKHELPVFRYTYSYPSRAATNAEEEAWDQYYQRGRSHAAGNAVRSGAASEKEAKKATPGFAGLMQKNELDINLNDIIEFEMYSFQPYIENDKENGKGMVVGWLPEEDQYIEVQVHQISKDDYLTNQNGYAQIISAFEKNDSLHLLGKVVTENIQTPPAHIDTDKIVEPQKEEVDEEDDWSFLDQIHDGHDTDDAVDVVTTQSGERFTQEEWRRSQHNTCCECGDPILFDDVKDVVIVNGYAFCGGCAATKTGKSPEEGVTSCGKRYTKEVWDSKHSRCCNCHHVHPFSDIGKVEIISGYSFCTDDDACDARAEKRNLPEAMADKEEFLEDRKVDSKSRFCTACGETHHADVIEGTMSYEKFKGLGSLCYWKAIHRDKFRTQILNDVVEKPHGFCDVCNQVHNVYVRTGNMSTETWEKLKEGCPVKEKYADQFSKKKVIRETLSLNKGQVVKLDEVRQVPSMTQVTTPTKKAEVICLPAKVEDAGKKSGTGIAACTCCGYEYAEGHVKGGVCNACRTRFHRESKTDKEADTTTFKQVDGKWVAEPDFPSEITHPSQLKVWEGNNCPDCGWSHTDKLIRGLVPLEILKESMLPKCRLVKYWIDVKSKVEEKKPEPMVINGFEVKTLQSQPPMIVSEEQWVRMNNCRRCGNYIPFEDADTVKFWASAPVCHSCEHDMALALKGTN